LRKYSNRITCVFWDQAVNKRELLTLAPRDPVAPDGRSVAKTVMGSRIERAVAVVAIFITG
jgi:hypothetical protein